MSVNIFGSGPVTTATTISRRGPPGIGFKYLDEEGNFDIENKRLANVAFPLEENDVTTKIYTDNLVTEIKSKVDETLKHTGDISTKINEIQKIPIEAINDSLDELKSEMYGLKNDIEKIKQQKSNVEDREFKNKVDNLSRRITELKSEDDHIKNYVEEMKAQLFDIHNTVPTKESFENALGTINKQIEFLNNKNNNIDSKSLVQKETCAYETIIFQTNSKLEIGKFPFALGMKGGGSNKTGYVMPYDGSIDTILLSSQDIDQHISVKLFINGNLRGDIYLDKYKEDEYFNIIRFNDINLSQGDIIQFQSNSETENIKMHVIQVFIRYALGRRFLMSDDFGNNIMIRDEPIEEEIDYSMLRGDAGNNLKDESVKDSKEIEFKINEFEDDKNVYKIAEENEI